MSAVTASLCSTLMFVLFVSADPKIITAESGQDVTLTCRAANNNITVLEWSRADLGDKNVLVYRDGQFTPDDQHPSFKNRVDLQDRQMKDGDVSLILKNVTINDTGIYKCGVGKKQPNQTNVDLKLINIITLKVVPPGKEDGSVWLIVGLPVLVLVPSVVFLLFLLWFLLQLVFVHLPADPHVAEHLQPPQHE
ncbi:sodium channel regulatory subunit beta-3-like, partial [Pelmatolapia mariae]|uniref:sodium channel regulatory subunit beta-3-like n=1 Tax=Pelmatolapia mariae TaxID=158779 RepID=UPI002FE523D2